MASHLPPHLPHRQPEPTDTDPKVPPQSGKPVAVTPSGPRGDNPATAGPGNTAVSSNTPENNLGHLNPSAPEDANTTPGSVGKK
jgi:hypothetical protein